MQKNTIKTMAIAALIIAVGGLTLGYAALTQVLNVNTNATVQKANNSWNIHFNEVDVYDGVIGGKQMYPINAGVTVESTGTSIKINNVVLKAPGDYITMQTTISNAGDIDALLSSITSLTPTITGTGTTKTADEEIIRNAYHFDLMHSRYCTTAYGDFAVGSILESKGKEKDCLSVEYRLSLDENLTELPTNDVTISGIGVNYNFAQK